MRFTASQWNAVQAVDRHVLVAAGAGTGKTRTVIGRLLYLLGVPLHGKRVSKPLALHDVAAITFTNAAAADLKDKLRKALRGAHRHEDAYLVDTARIGTIHAFCADVLREFALRTSGNPRAEVLDEATTLGITAQAVRDTLVTALETNVVDGVGDLLAAWSVRHVERFVGDLLRDLDRLRVIAKDRERMDRSERALVDLATHAQQLVERRLAERGAIDFDRLIVGTRDILTGDATALAALRRRVHTLIIDEFQDVDPVQQQIAFLLGDPRSERTDTPRLMLVGDPKQSIYRFRRADVTVWTAVEHDFREKDLGLVVDVAENFRSTSPILGFVDATVGSILDRPENADTHRNYEVPYHALALGNAKQATGAPVELIVIPTQPDGRDYLADDLRQIEATAVARRARELVEQGEASWGDMAVIVPTWSTAEIHRAAIARAGGPAFLLKAGGFYEQREIVDLVVALEAIRDPLDDRALVGFLRSPFVGVSDEVLLEIARQSERPYWPALTTVSVTEQPLLRQGVATLHRLLQLRDRVPLDELLDTLFEDTGFLAHLRLKGADRLQAIVNVERFVRHAQVVAHQTLGEFLATIAEMRRLGTDEGDVPQIPPADTVTITTIHSAKGLEWDVVFWCDLVSRAQYREGRPLLIGRRTIALKDADVDPDAAPAGWQALRDTIGREEYAERKRVWYVAATRAKERLFVSGLPAGRMGSGGRATVADHLWTALGEVSLEEGGGFHYEAADGTPFEGQVRLADASMLEEAVSTARPEVTVEPVDVLRPPPPAVHAPAGRVRHSATEFLSFRRCERRHWFTYVMGVREPEVDRSTREFIDAVTRGKIVHDVLEHLRGRDELDRLLEDAIKRCDPDAPVPEQPEGQRYRQELRVEIQQVADHPEYRAVADLPSARRELRFLSIGRPGVYYEGGIDLAGVEDPDLVLLDVKTSAVDESDARSRAQRYQPQRDVYVAAAEHISGRRVGRFAFQFSRSGTQVSEAIAEDLRARLPERLAHAVRGMEAGRSRLTDYPQECRFCGFKRIGWCPGVDEGGPAPSEQPSQQLTLGLG